MSKNEHGEFGPADPENGQAPVGPPPVAYRELSPVELDELQAQEDDAETPKF